MKSVSILKFIDQDKYVVYPSIIVKGSGTIAVPPYLSGKGLSFNEVWDMVTQSMEVSGERERVPNGDGNTLQKEFLKGVGVKSMKELHEGSILLEIYTTKDTMVFSPWQNSGPRTGFTGFKEKNDVVLPLNAERDQYLQALKLAISKCK